MMIISWRLMPINKFIWSVGLVGSTVLGLAGQPLIPEALAASDSGKARIITVSGEGIVQSPPDMASVMIGVVTQGKTADEAVNANTEAIHTVISALKTIIPERRDLVTSTFSVQPRYVYPKEEENKAPRIDGYEVRNRLTVRVRDLTKLGNVLDIAIRTGSNQISGISFGLADDKPFLDKARAQAIEDAKRKAKIYAEAANVKLGRILSIEADTLLRQQPQMLAMHAGAPVSVEAGEQDYAATVTVMWELAD